MLTLTEKVLFALAALFSAYGSWLGLAKVYRVILRGSGAPLKINPGRVLAAASNWISMRPLWKTRRIANFFHAMIAWGFVFYLLVNVGDVLQGYGTEWPFLQTRAGDVYRLLADSASVLVLIGMTWFLLRRFLWGRALDFQDNTPIPPATRRAITRDSIIVGLFILGHVGFRLLGESVVLHLEYVQTGALDPFQPFASIVQPLWAGLDQQSLVIARHVCWWISLGLILCFVPYFPYTKHFHFVMAGVNFWTRPERSSLGALDPTDFEDESAEVFGALKIEDLPQTSLVDAFACIMCNRCQDACPAYVTGKELSPSALEINKRYYLNQHLDEMASGAVSIHTLLDFAITESAVWACTTCGACVDVCPVGNEPMFDILELRRGLVLTEGRFPEEWDGAFRGMERNGNPWNIGSAQRMAWAEGLDIPTVDDNPDASILWWVGCAPAHDPRAQRTARALAQVLHSAGVSFATLGRKERCTGDSARRSGNEYLFQELAQANIAALNAADPLLIVTTCPHCLHTLAREYPALGGHYEVIHHTQLLARLASEGKIQLREDADATTVTFHDPCYLGRHNAITDAPREAIEALPVTSVEMPRHGKQSFCCGAGGGQMWKEEEPGSEAVSHARYREAAATGAATLAVGCPFCLLMLNDTSQTTEGGPIVKDVVELYAERLA